MPPSHAVDHVLIFSVALELPRVLDADAARELQAPMGSNLTIQILEAIVIANVLRQSSGPSSLLFGTSLVPQSL